MKRSILSAIFMLLCFNITQAKFTGIEASAGVAQFFNDYDMDIPLNVNLSLFTINRWTLNLDMEVLTDVTDNPETYHDWMLLVGFGYGKGFILLDEKLTIDIELIPQFVYEGGHHEWHLPEDLTCFGCGSGPIENVYYVCPKIAFSLMYPVNQNRTSQLGLSASWRYLIPFWNLSRHAEDAWTNIDNLQHELRINLVYCRKFN